MQEWPITKKSYLPAEINNVDFVRSLELKHDSNLTDLQSDNPISNDEITNFFAAKSTENPPQIPDFINRLVKSHITETCLCHYIDTPYIDPFFTKIPSLTPRLKTTRTVL